MKWNLLAELRTNELCSPQHWLSCSKQGTPVSLMAVEAEQCKSFRLFFSYPFTQKTQCTWQNVRYCNSKGLLQWHVLVSGLILYRHSFHLSTIWVLRGADTWSGSRVRQRALHCGIKVAARPHLVLTENWARFIKVWAKFFWIEKQEEEQKERKIGSQR